ncbi:OB-fold protein [Winogradskyella jejuensis]|uniref:tRNA_anti-like n=1 Tax=Winogradskyella jejuensis TaxID=1089305 RepID=A0A1M5MEI2_9FLAO|nr:hypothetical protein [Winogradskyella jejuensis]SHG75646.1 tRNA_anti-like [Winogradskyella jejuensis]
MKKKELIVTGVLLVILLSVFTVYNYVFNAEHRDIAAEEAVTTMTAKEIFDHFKVNEALATTTYLDKVIELKGEVTEIEDNNLVLSNGVQVSFLNNKDSNLKTGTQIVIKGRCVGYDELLELVKIDQSTLIK